jgi:hypothetical protein
MTWYSIQVVPVYMRGGYITHLNIFEMGDTNHTIDIIKSEFGFGEP